MAVKDPGFPDACADKGAGLAAGSGHTNIRDAYPMASVPGGRDGALIRMANAVALTWDVVQFGLPDGSKINPAKACRARGVRDGADPGLARWRDPWPYDAGAGG
ncbi:MAG: hypothetical protein AAFY39_13830 [Pseudomonadota bacterium]